MDEVVVTGVGVVTPIGTGADAFWDGLMTGRNGAGPVTRFDASDHQVRIACEVKDFEPTEYLPAREAGRADRFAQFGVAAARLAWQDAGLGDEAPDPERSGASIGTALGGTGATEQEALNLANKGPRRVNPISGLKINFNEASALVAMDYQLLGPSYALSSACATGGHAIGEAARVIRSGDADLMVAGGADAAITPVLMATYARMGAISQRNDEPQRASRPFDAERDGFVFAEGAGVLILESRAHAEKRGVRVLATLAGYGAATDAYHLVQPHPEGRGAESAIRAALRDVDLDDVDYINAHGTGTQFNDRIETLMIKKVFGEDAKRLAVSSTKSQIGHLMGAAGAVEAAVCVLAIDRGRIPGTINLENPDPDCDLDYLSDGPREAKVRVALSNSFGLGGANACVAFRAP